MAITARWKSKLVVFTLAALYAELLPAQPTSRLGTEKVSAAGELDWSYVLTGRSTLAPGDVSASAYNSRSQAYDLFMPGNAERGETMPLVIYVSPSNRSKGWHFWEAICRRHDAMYVSPKKCGNSVDFDQRIRIVLDVLDDVRRKYSIDPDRTYIAGFSGGALVAQQIAMKLPEHFGGLINIGHVCAMPQEPALRHRTRDRLSLALLCGERDPIAPMLEYRDAHVLKGFGYRCEIATVPRLGHKIPPVEILERAFLWLEEGLADRQRLAAEFPATRSPQPVRAEIRAAALLGEAASWLARETETFRATELLNHITSRWSDLPVAAQAQQKLESVRSESEPALSGQRDAETRQIAILWAEGLQRLATAPARVRFVRDQQGAVALEAIAHWERLLTNTDDEVERSAIGKHIEQLRVAARQTADQQGGKALRSTRFRLVGTVTVGEGLKKLRAALDKLGYELAIDQNSFPKFDELAKESRYLQLPAASVEQALRELLAVDELQIAVRGKLLRVTRESNAGRDEP